MSTTSGFAPSLATEHVFGSVAGALSKVKPEVSGEALSLLAVEALIRVLLVDSYVVSMWRVIDTLF